MKRVTHKDVEAACARYNKALGLKYWRAYRGEQLPPSIGYLQWADIKGDGTNRRGLYAVCNERGGVCSSDLREPTMRKTIRAIDSAIKCHRLPAFALITRAIHERGAKQKAALRELNRRGLWLSEDQKTQAGLIRRFKTHTRHGFLISRTAGADAPWRGWREDGVSFRADTLAAAFRMAKESR